MARPEIDLGNVTPADRLTHGRRIFGLLPPSGDDAPVITPDTNERVELGEKYAAQRQELREYAERWGEILPKDHEFAKLVDRVIERLGWTNDTEVLVIDSEGTETFFHPESRTIAFSRGFGRYFLSKGLPLTEDHIAAVLAHELEHAEVHGDDYLHRIKTSYLERISRGQNHAEEYRADAEAMRRLSRAGYNPRAIIDILRSLPLTEGRHDSGHPEQIERIRKLEDRLADDEYPLSNTTKELTPLEEGLLTWLAGDSDVYNTTDKLIHSTPEEITKGLMAVETQAQFWELYSVKRHFDRVASAKAIAAREHDRLGRIAVKLMVFRAFCGHKPHLDGEPIQIPYDINNALIDVRGGLTDQEYTQVFDAERPFSDGYKLVEYFKSNRFRQTIVAGQEIGNELAAATGKLETIESFIDRAVRDRLNTVATAPVSEEVKRYYEELQRCFESGQASQDLFLTLYSDSDLATQLAVQHRSNLEVQERGLREGELVTTGLIDFRSEEGRVATMEQVIFALAGSLIENPQPSIEIIHLLAQSIDHDTDFSAQESALLAHMLLNLEGEKNWLEYLHTQDKGSLKRLIGGIKQINLGKRNLRFSPVRSMHQSYLESAQQNSGSGVPCALVDGGNHGLDSSGFAALKMLTAQELYLRGYPPGFKYDFSHRLSPRDINLTIDEWDAVVEGNATHGIWAEQGEWALVKYLDQLNEGGFVDPKLEVYASEHGLVSDNTDLSPEQIRLLTHCTLWDNTRLQVMVNTAIKNWFEGKKYPDGKPVITFRDTPEATLSEVDRTEIVSTLREVYALFSANPVDKDKIKYGELPKPESIASRLLDVQIQDYESKGSDKSSATVNALNQLAGEGIFPNYIAISDSTLDKIGALSQDEINTLLRSFRASESNHANRQDLIEHFQLLALVPDAFRQEAARHPVCEATMKDVLATHGHNAVEWIEQHFQPTDLRDILLIGVYELSSEEQKPQFQSHIDRLLTGNPDQFNAKHSSVYPLDRYIRDVKQEHEDASRYIGAGRVAEYFPDLIRRRHPFATLALNSKGADFVLYNRFGIITGEYGSIYQGYVARKLLANEPVIFNRSRSIEERLQSLTQAAPQPSVVRDIHLEILLREELRPIALNVHETVALGSQVLPLFTEKSGLKGPLATQVFRAETAADPEIFQDFERYLQVLTHYMPEPSLARNYFLNQFENNASLTVEQLRQINAMRMSPEGKRFKDDSAPWTFVVSRLGELNRPQRVKAALWLLGLSPDKPKAILGMENRFDGHLDTFPSLITTATDDERDVTYKRLLLGAEGIVDLEAVDPEKLERAKELRDEFVQALSIALLPDEMPNAALFRSIFSRVIESSDPTHATRIITKLINRMSKYRLRAKELPPEEVIAISLNELGVVGKKVSQSLAELSWVPYSYKYALRRAQTEGEIVPKRALLLLAEDAGLLAADSPLRIHSIDQLIGAASNKQAALLTVEVTDESVGLPKGRHQVVGKFKRPSAQKTTNIDHDLKVLNGILEVLSKDGHADVLPKDFSAQISEAVRKELDFKREQQFSGEIRPDLEARNAKRRYKITVPQIYLAMDDVMFESVAQGISLRMLKDLHETGAHRVIERGYLQVSIKSIHQSIVTEALSQLITTGNIHADLHPGNVFVDRQGNLTLIDLGMHERLSPTQRLNAVSLIAGLVTGNEAYVRQTLKEFGWDVGSALLNLKKFDFNENVAQLVKASQNATTAPPELLGSVILASSKLTTYARDLSNVDLLKALIGSVNSREAPQIIAHLVQSGGRRLLTRE